MRSRTTGDGTLLFLAHTAVGRPQEALIANQARLLAKPALVQALLDNPELTNSGRRLLSELTEEFFEKKARRFQSDARRDAAALAEAAESDAAGAEDDEDLDLDSGEDEDQELLDDSEAEASAEAPEEDNSVFIGAIYRRVGLMTIGEKIALAYTGSKDERRVLVGDSNKLIGVAVLKSRSLSLNEVEGYATMRNLDEELYRRIAANREWIRKPTIIVALVKNPRVPLDVSLPLLKRLSTRELRTVFRDRNLAPALRASANKLLIIRRR